MKMNQWVKGLCAVAFCGMIVSIPMAAEASQIPEGVYVGENSLGGMTQEEAEAAIKDYVDSLSEQKITLDIAGEPVDTTASELGFHWSNEDAAIEAANAVSGGNLIKRYMVKKDLEAENLVIPLETAVEDEKVAAFVQEKCEGLAAAPQNASITRTDGKFVLTPGVAGKVVDIEATKNALNDALKQGLDKPIQVAAVVAEEQPAITTEALSTIGDVLGTFSTSFASSGKSRSTNLRVGSGKINGRVLMPGEVLSGYECMQPFTTSNGYATAAAYENGMVVDSVGGGVCQISTTLYNAVLRAELEVVQRQNHSMIVTYVDPSADAAIAGTYKDLKFKNNYSTPIYVEGYTSGKTLYFTIYGKETRPANRTLEFVSETLSIQEPGAPITKVDPTLAPGARVVVQSSHRGRRSRLWKVVKVDGKETERTLLHTDTYNASPQTIRVGPEAPVTAPVVDTPPVQTAPVETAPTTPAPVEGPNGGPGVTAPAPTPAPTQAPEPAPVPAPAPEAQPAGPGA